MTAMILLLAAWTAAAEKPHPLDLPEGFGVETIDVSGYPAEHQKTYREIFLRVYPLLRGGTRRGVNSPLIELDPQGEQALRRDAPELFADPRLAKVSPEVWRLEAFTIKNRPPCCGACPVLSMEDARALWRFLAYDSIQRKTGPRAKAWAAYRKRLIERFEEHQKDEALQVSTAAPEFRRP